MQNADGSVCHYVLGNPNTATQPQQVSDVSSFAAACAAGVFAKAYTALGDSLPATQASNLLYSARLSWAWLTNNPDPAWPRLALVNGLDGGGWDTNSYWGTTNDDHRQRAFAAVELPCALVSCTETEVNGLVPFVMVKGMVREKLLPYAAEAAL